jgi:hypothetical protein
LGFQIGTGMPTGKPLQHLTLIHWLVGLVVHGAGAGVLTGAVLLASANLPADLLFMQANVGLAVGLYFYACAQVGTSAALLIGCCAEGHR